MRSFKRSFQFFKCYYRETIISTYPKRLQIRQTSGKCSDEYILVFPINLAIFTYVFGKMEESNITEGNDTINSTNKQNEQLTELAIESNGLQFQCSECGFSSSNEAEIQSHELSHSADSRIHITSEEDICAGDKNKMAKSPVKTKYDRSCACSKCGYQCTSYKDLSSHMLCHTGEEPFSCPHCDFKCTNLGSVKVHMLEHNDKRPISCPTCENAHHITQGGNNFSLLDQSLRIVSINVNLMPVGLLSFLTSGKSEDRAIQLVDFILKNHGNNTDIFYIQELYHVDASQVFINKMEEAEFQHFAGPRAGTYDGSDYKYNSGQVIFINKKRLDLSLHNSKEERNQITEIPLVDEKTISEEQEIAKNHKYTVTHLESLSFPSHGIHGKGALEKDVPKGAIWLRLKVNNVNEKSEIEEQILDTYYLHLQSDPLALLFNFTPQQVRREQIETVREFSVTNTENIKIPHHSLFIGDLNIDSQWDEFKSIKELLNVTPVSEEKHVTIGSPSNTSHYPLIWKIGGLLYDHYEAQLDHCLVSPSLKQLQSKSAAKSPLAFGTFPLIMIKENREGGGTPTEERSSLTDHEGIFVELNI